MHHPTKAIFSGKIIHVLTFHLELLLNEKNCSHGEQILHFKSKLHFSSDIRHYLMNYRLRILKISQCRGKV